MSHYVHATVQSIEPAHVTFPGDKFRVHPGDGRSSLGCEALLFSFQGVQLNLIRILRYFNMSFLDHLQSQYEAAVMSRSSSQCPVAGNPAHLQEVGHGRPCRTSSGDGPWCQRKKGGAKVKSIALQVLADLIESGEDVPEPLMSSLPHERLALATASSTAAPKDAGESSALRRFARAIPVVASERPAAVH
jgi:hypothetical protein